MKVIILKGVSYSFDTRKLSQRLMAVLLNWHSLRQGCEDNKKDAKLHWYMGSRRLFDYV